MPDTRSSNTPPPGSYSRAGASSPRPGGAAGPSGDPGSGPLDVYFIAIGGTGMAPLAALLEGKGHRVRGSDGPLYPPMSTLLQAAGIEPEVGFDPAHLEPPPDLVVVGNAVPRENPEAREVERRGLERISMPQAVARFFLAGRRPLVIAGTHGKTTTTAMASWVYTACGREPGYLVGGVPKNLGVSFAAGSGERFIIEGDEYNAAYFDRGAKFLHYCPQTLILTSAEYDHADLYPRPEALLEAYARLIALLPPDGLLVACGDWPAVRRLAAEAPCPVLLYGLGEDNDVTPAGPVVAEPGGMRVPLPGDAGEIVLPAWGEHNVLNALAVWAAARHDGLPATAVASALEAFAGVARRLDVVGTAGGVTVIDDFAHHPTAVEATLAALAGRYPDRRRVTLFEPRSLTAGRELFHDAYRQAFALADRVYLAPVFHAGRLEEDERLDSEALARELTAAGTPAFAAAGNDELLARALSEVAPGDVVVTMSSGSFDRMPQRLLAALAERAGSSESAEPALDEVVRGEPG